MDLDVHIGDRITYKNSMNDIRKVIIKDEEQKNKYCNNKTAFEIYKKGVITEHITIETDNLKELILETHKDYWHDYTLKAKIKAVTRYAEFDNDRELLNFLKFMEE